MTSEGFDLTRRKFMIVSSAAIAAPLIMNAVSMVANVEETEKKVTYFVKHGIIYLKF